MSIYHTFIIVKGQPKTLQIDKIELQNNGVYAIKYKNSATTFHYRRSDVVFLKDYVCHDPRQCKIFVEGRELYSVTLIQSFQHESNRYWRITFSNGFVRDYMHGEISVIESCLSDCIAKNSFEYLKRVAQINELGKQEDQEGLLSSIYERIDFINEKLVIAPYLDAQKYKIEKKPVPDLIFPFGCNASQEKAVTAAFENQLSVIQGPPGTGKTQTILNIIANILMQGKTVMVVSNNNSAIINVQEKLQKYGIGFLVASLGKRENKEAFIENQPSLPSDAEFSSWKLLDDVLQRRVELKFILTKLQKVFVMQSDLASAKQELHEVELEWEHLKHDYEINADACVVSNGVHSKKLMNLWIKFQSLAEKKYDSRVGFLEKAVDKLKWKWLNFIRKYILGIKSPFDLDDIQSIIKELQALFLITRIEELKKYISEINRNLALWNDKSLTSRFSSLSMSLFKNSLYEKYHRVRRKVFSEVKELSLYPDVLCRQFPVILSTTFSARTTLPNIVYDYIIMDEASQVSIETGALALTCARNAVIVGDTLQLKNVVTEEDCFKLKSIFNAYAVSEGYDCAKYSFLQSVCLVLPNVKQTLLQEHYRCHPKIINFCNQRFYGGKLLIMTEDNDERDVMMVVKTIPGNHSRGHYNQREIDVVMQEVLPSFENDNVGIIAPYNVQVNAFKRQIPNIEVATIHKYQGREKDSIVMSVVDDQITEFSDDPNLLNVAVSRAKKHFCLVVTGNEQNRKGIITDLIEYINYNSFVVTESKLSSIFDYLYSQYTKERMAFFAGHDKVSKYDSENLVFSLIENTLSEYVEFQCLRVFCHTPLRTIIKDWSLLDDDERRYISHYGTHLDFLIVNHVTRKPVLAIEADGYNFHNEETVQYRRDQMKNHILEVYELPLLRLSTVGYGEKEKIVMALSEFFHV